MLSAEECREEALFMGLRLAEGLDLDRLFKTRGLDIWASYGSHLSPYVNAGWLLHEPGRRLALTRAGMLMANDVMAVFIGRTVR
jgi:oxygen-independent coproporphyrinogen-3 oxidase